VIYASDPSLAAEFFADPDAEAGLFDMLGRGPAILPPPTEDALDTPVRRGPWTMLVKNRSGSLEQLVSLTRRRNLAVSFGILLLMAASLAALLLSARRAQKLAELQMEFVAGVSHELRTPLAVICSAADNLADGLVSNIGQVKCYGSVIRGEGRRLSRMVEQILGFAGIQRGRAKYELESVDLGEVIQAAVKACDAEVQQSGCDVNVRLDPGLPLVTADAVALVHCFRNLIDNALTHGRSGGCVSVEAHAAGGAVEVRVADRGPGIPKSDLPHLFKPFFRGSGGEPLRGFGLGLALVKHVVAAHSGRVNVTSTLGQGACFVVTIPAGPTPAVSENPNAGHENPAH
jgi:signal transduction histidine kinase